MSRVSRKPPVCLRCTTQDATQHDVGCVGGPPASETILRFLKETADFDHDWLATVLGDMFKAAQFGHKVRLQQAAIRLYDGFVEFEEELEDSHE